MYFIKTKTTGGAVRVPVYAWHEMPYTQIMFDCKESKTRQKISYLEIPCAFDIETTNIYQRIKSGKNKGKIDPDFNPYAFMYHWQFCIGHRVVFGRTWSEFQNMLNAIDRNMNLSKNLRLVVYVFNLSFEMQFMRRFLNVTDSFCKDDRHPLKVVHNECIEFRCAAALTNMSLEVFTKNENCKFQKLGGDLDYNVIRTQETELSETEQGYCYNDVRGLSEGIQSLLRFDTLATIPLTSTGYVRRDARISMKQNKANRRIFRESALSSDEYQYMRAAFRGGDTHANARFANQRVKSVHSYDIASSYPACMMIDNFPMSKFIPISLETFFRFRREQPGQFCYLLHLALYNIEFTSPHGVPYIAIAKTKHLSGDHVKDNGRVLSAGSVTLWVTDIDADIIFNEYKIDSYAIESVYCAFSGPLPAEYKRVIMDYYEKKTALKGLKDDESLYLYNKSKNRVNALYGMMAMRIDQDETKYTGAEGSGYETTSPPLDEIIEKYYKRRASFLPYQWGVWVTAHARRRLHEFYNIVGRDLVYGDTDSAKILHHARHKKAIDELNARLKDQAEAAGAWAPDRNGVKQYMGVWDDEGEYNEMKTLGAKKYVVEIEGRCYSTIAGVNKEAGQRYFEKNGLNGFRIGATIENSGHLVAYYNDDEIHTITVDGCQMVSASNLALIDDTYTIGVTDDYMNILTRFAAGAVDLS